MALQVAESVQSSPSAWAVTHLNMGQAYRKKKEFDKAITSFRRVLELDPKNFKAHSSLGISLMMSGRKEEAILAFHEVGTNWKLKAILMPVIVCRPCPFNRANR